MILSPLTLTLTTPFFLHLPHLPISFTLRSLSLSFYWSFYLWLYHSLFLSLSLFFGSLSLLLSRQYIICPPSSPISHLSQSIPSPTPLFFYPFSALALHLALSHHSPSLLSPLPTYLFQSVLSRFCSLSQSLFEPLSPHPSLPLFPSFH